MFKIFRYFFEIELQFQFQVLWITREHISILEGNLPRAQAMNIYWSIPFDHSAKLYKYCSFGTQIWKICNIWSKSLILINIHIISMLDFIKIGHIAILRPNLPKFLILGHDPQHQMSYLWLKNLICSECQISKHGGYVSFFEPNFPGMRRLILVLMCVTWM